jgi:hypothetical protein
MTHRLPLSRHLWLYVALLALLANTTLPFFAVYALPYDAPPPATASNTSTGLYGDKILLCTGQGLRWVDRDALGDTQNDPATPHPQMQCALCYLAAQGHLNAVDAAPHGAALLALPPQIQPIFPSYASLWHAQRLTAGHYGRAPPALYS